MELRNPYIFAPLEPGDSDGTGVVTGSHIAFYEQRAPEVGAIIPEPFYLAPTLRERPTQLGMDSPDKLPGLQRLTASIHQRGAKVIAHLNHPGRLAHPNIPGNIYWSSVSTPCENGGATPVAMHEAHMAQVEELFVKGALLAKEAGFDALELQMGHGYLLAQFLSPMINTRKDAYGGSFEGRFTFPLRVVRRVMESVSLPVIVGVSGAEMVDGTIPLEETIRLTQQLRSLRVEAIHVSAGTICSPPQVGFQHTVVPREKTWELAAAIHEATGTPVAVAGHISNLNEAQNLATRHGVKYVALG